MPPTPSPSPVPAPPGADRAAHAILTVDLEALAANYALVAAAAAPSRTGAVVKANAYGLGAAQVAARLAAAGCADFFVANLAEGLALREALPAPRILVLGGLPRGTAARFREAALVPVLNTVEEAREWAAEPVRAPCALQLDSGMTRAGLDAREVARLAADPALAKLELALVMTHLACADDPRHPQNEAQVAAFEAMRARLPAAPTSIGNSAGTLSGLRFRGDLVRPGIALYGGDPFVAGRGPQGLRLREVVRLQGRILQLHDVADPVAVGYGATYRVKPPARLATVGVGYADGYLRALGGRGVAVVAGRRVPVVGRVSMDLVTLDVTSVPRDAVAAGDYADLVGGGVGLDEVAAAAGTIAYEMLTRLAPRTARSYR